jgi:hypothetical protein
MLSVASIRSRCDAKLNGFWGLKAGWSKNTRFSQGTHDHSELTFECPVSTHAIAPGTGESRIYFVDKDVLA